MKGIGPANAVAVDAMDDRLWAMDHLGEGFFQRPFVGAHPDHVVAIARPVVADIAAGRKEAVAGGCDNDGTNVGRIGDALQASIISSSVWRRHEFPRLARSMVIQAARPRRSSFTSS